MVPAIATPTFTVIPEKAGIHVEARRIAIDQMLYWFYDGFPDARE
jgi:hypothetical protein